MKYFTPWRYNGDYLIGGNWFDHMFYHWFDQMFKTHDRSASIIELDLGQQ